MLDHMIREKHECVYRLGVTDNLEIYSDYRI